MEVAENNDFHHILVRFNGAGEPLAEGVTAQIWLGSINNWEVAIKLVLARNIVGNKERSSGLAFAENLLLSVTVQMYNPSVERILY